MRSAPGQVVLVAMPGSGETLLIRDGSGTLWLVPAAGAAHVVDDSAIDDAVRKHGWDLVDAAFDTWQDLEEERQARAATLAPHRNLGIADYDAEDIARLLDAARRRIEDGNFASARSIVIRMLREIHALTSDTPLYAQALDVLDTANRAELPPPRPVLLGVRPAHVSLLHRMALDAA